MTLSARNWAWSVARRTPLGKESPGPDGRVPLKPGEKLVLLCIAEHENAEDGYSYPSYDTIAAKTGLSVRSVQTHVQTLEAAGAFEIRPQRRRDGKFARYTYWLNVPDSYRESDAKWLSNQT